MSDNPQSPADAAFRLPQYHVLRLAGRDAVAFAQAQFMNDVAALADGHWHWNGWLSPKGRVQALFALLRLDAETLWLVGTGEAASLAASLSRFRFRSRVAIDLLADAVVAGTLALPVQAAGAMLAAEADGLELDLSGDGGPRTLRIGSAERTVPPADEAGSDAWFALDLLHGWPAVPRARLDAFTPQQLSLDRFPAFSVRKGCYPGQEIVARTHFLGRAKRGAVLLDTRGAEPGAPVTLDGAPSGEVAAASRGLALAVMPLERQAGALMVGDQRAQELAIRDGLAR